MLGSTSFCAVQVWIQLRCLVLVQLMVQRQCLKFFRTQQLRISLLIMASILILRCFEHGRTDWDSQYLSWEEVYCAITALDGYHSHSDNIHYIWSVTLIYALPPSMDHDHHFHLQHSSHPPLLLADICLCPSRAI